MRRFSPILLIIILAFLVRVIGLNFGLPFTYHDDEPVIVNYALSYGMGDFSPRTFYVPPLLSYLLFFEYGILYLIGLLFGFFRNINGFGYLFLNNPTIFYLIGRFTFGVLPGCAAVFFLYLLGKRVFNKPIGIIAAFFLAINFLHVRNSHYIYFDIPLTLFLIILFIKSVDLIRTNSVRDYLSTGLLIGVVTGIKYFGPMLGVFLAAVLVHNLIFYRNKTPGNLRKISLLILVSMVSFFLLNPYAFLQYGKFLKAVAKISVSSQDTWFHLKVSLAGSLGLRMLFCGLLGLGMAIIKKNKPAALLAVFVLSYYLIITMKSQAAERYVMPMVPVLLLFAAYLTHSISESMKSRVMKKGALVAVSLLLVFPSAHKVFLADRLFLRDDTRTQAYHWIKENIPPRSTMALDALRSWFPRLEKTKKQLAQVYEDSRDITFQRAEGALDFKKKLMLSNPGYPENTYILYYMRASTIRGFHSVYPDMLIEFDGLIQRGVDYVVVSSSILGDERYHPFVKRLRENSILLRSFSPYLSGIKRIKPEEETTLPAAAFSMKELKARRAFGPYIEIYQLNKR